MTTTLKELCRHIQNCTEKLEEEIKRNIIDCHKLLLSNEATETKLALENAKDYHYKEILDFIGEIVNNIRKIIFHEEKIRKLKDEKGLTPEEIKRYSHVQRQISVFSNNEEVVTKREKRRVASEVSLESLEAWELYLEKKSEEEEKTIQVEKSVIPKRKRVNSARKKKKFISSTFNNFLEDRNASRKLDSILEDSTSESESNLNDTITNKDNKSNYCISIPRQIISSNENVFNHDEKSAIHESQLKFSNAALRSSIESENDSENSINEEEKELNEKCSVLNIVGSLNHEYFLQEANDTKPKIIDVVYKKQGD